jgi:ABC-type transport system substrate-binding protein
MSLISRFVARAALPLLAALLIAPAQAADPPKVLRYPFRTAETGFDPAKINDLYSRIVTGHIYDGLYEYDHLARPFKIKPNTADGMPVVSDDFRTWTIKIKRGIYFDDDPAFKGKKRELTANDYVYSWKRFYDPVNKSPVYSGFKEEGVLGVEALREEVLKDRVPFDYDREVEGIRALDRYTLQFKLEKPRPRFLYSITSGDLFGAVAREVIEAYGDKSMEHPVGTGPFRLASWRRSSLIVLERNPNYREVFYDAEPNADDAEGQAMLAKFKGRRLPMIDRVEVRPIEESQPRWLAFLNGEFDLINEFPTDFANQAVPGGKIAPHLAKRGIHLHRTVATDRTLFYMNWEDPLVGGFAPEKVALRRAIRLAYDTNEEIRGVRRGQAIPAQSVVAPGTYGYDPALKTENSDFDPARAKALLDMYGYVDRDGDGWRERPDGSRLELVYGSQPDATSRQFDELWKKCMDRIGLRLKVEVGQWSEQLKKARAGQMMIWQLGYSAASPDGADSLGLLYGPASGGQNLSRFKSDKLDSIVDRMRDLPDGPDRLALLREGIKLVDAYAPIKVNVHRILNDFSHPWVEGYRRPPFSTTFWSYVDIDPVRQAAKK